MAGMMTFKINVHHENTDVFPELQYKVKHLEPLFEHIIQQWAKQNKEKFGFSVGKSMTGDLVDPTVHWDALSPAYFKAKSKHYPDQIMVRTGSLLQSLTKPDLFFQMVLPEQVVFGSPTDPDDLMKVQYNWEKRQTIFLGKSDQDMIRELESKFFTVEMKSMKDETHQMDIDFANTVSE